MPEKLTDARVRGAPLRTARYSILDTKEAGLELRIHPDGRRVFALRRSVGGKDVRVTIGSYGLEPPAFTLEKARAEAAALKVRFHREGDFRGAEREAQRVARESRQYTLGDLADDWLKDAAKRLRASTVALHKHRIDKHIRPRFGKRALTDITRADVRGLINELGDRPRTANTVALLLTQLYRYARSELERDVPNPAADLKPFRESSRQRVLSDDEIRSFWAGLENPALPPGPQVAIALKIALFSCQRIGEIIGARDNELDFEEHVWIVPPCRTKSGRENRVPLTPYLEKLFRQAQALRAPPKKSKQPVVWGAFTANAPVFNAPGSQIEPMLPHSASTAMARLCADHLEWAVAAAPHDLRRTSRTIMARERLGIPYDDAERVMSHLTGSAVSRVYVVDDWLPQKRRALERLDAELDRIVFGRAVDQSTNVVPLERTA
jgi:integrase